MLSVQSLGRWIFFSLFVLFEFDTVCLLYANKTKPQGNKIIKIKYNN